MTVAWSLYRLCVWSLYRLCVSPQYAYSFNCVMSRFFSQHFSTSFSLYSYPWVREGVSDTIGKIVIYYRAPQPECHGAWIFCSGALYFLCGVYCQKMRLALKQKRRILPGHSKKEKGKSISFIQYRARHTGVPWRLEICCGAVYSVDQLCRVYVYVF